MPRRRDVPKREVLPDPKFGSQDVSKFINAIMQSLSYEKIKEMMG